MEQEAGEMLLIVGGTVLLVCYGMRVRRERRRWARRPPKGSPAHEARIRRAFEAEWGLPPGTLEQQDGSVETATPWDPAGEGDPFGTVLCPGCGATYRSGIPYCELCGSETVDEDEVQRKPRRSPVDRLSAPLVCVLETTENVEATVVRSLLESHDIPTTMTGPIALNIHVFHRIGAASIRVLVLEPDAEQARRVIAAAR